MGYYVRNDDRNILRYYPVAETDYPNGIPSDCIEITRGQWIDSFSNPGKYIIENGSLVLAPPPSDEELIEQAKQKKISELRNGYSQTIENGFNVTIGSTNYILGFSTDDKTNLNATQTAVDRGYQQFPILYADIKGNPITLASQSDLDTVEQTATKFAFAQHQQILNLVGQAQLADLNTIDSIQWAPATY